MALLSKHQDAAATGAFSSRDELLLILKQAQERKEMAKARPSDPAPACLSHRQKKNLIETKQNKDKAQIKPKQQREDPPQHEHQALARAYRWQHL